VSKSALLNFCRQYADIFRNFKKDALFRSIDNMTMQAGASRQDVKDAFDRIMKSE